MWKCLKRFRELGSGNSVIPNAIYRRTRPIPRDWKVWIRHNVSRGCSKDEIFKILYNHQFDYDVIVAELNYEPNVLLEQIDNSLKSCETKDMSLLTKSSHILGGTRQIFIPNAVKVDSDRVELYILENFLNTEECQKIIDIMRGHLRPSTIGGKDEPDQYFRTSKSSDLALLNTTFVKELDQRICKIMGINSSYSEEIQAHLYDVGEQFKPHTDYFEPNSVEFEQFASDMGQRTWTFMVYLNDTERGGGTRFVNLNKTIYPRKGRALIWNNLHSNGAPNYDTLHHGLVIDQGYKAIVTKWFRARGRGRMFTKEDNEYIPNYTHSGIKKLKMPRGIHHMLLDFYEQNKEKARVEIVKNFITNADNIGSEVIELPDSLKAEIHSELQSICEDWCRLDLEPTYVYGIRKYKKNTTLKLHRDRISTHIISAILVVTQDVSEAWPLEIEDNYYRICKIIADPGDMILYEGARLKHGRPQPLNGNYFSTVYVHYRPKRNRSLA